MPVYDFDIAHEGTIDEDYDSRELRDLGAARVALSVLDLLTRKQKAMTGAVIQICDERQQVLASVPVDLAAPATPRRETSNAAS